MNAVLWELIFKLFRVVPGDVPFNILTETPVLTIDRSLVSGVAPAY